MDCLKITDGLVVNEDFILVTYTMGMGQVPETTEKFLSNNFMHIKGVAASGNWNWGERQFAKSGRIISARYGVPLLLRFELGGTPDDVDKFKREVDKIDNNPNSEVD